ncbi:hypothetical protein, partial [Streptomyces sp. IBSBF 2950]|uniref:hypothetical protein n=1 Tax=Streptomyces sp. IBSBF 2950 TaxID=2903528 RepID=UPI002FDC717F
MVRVAAGQAAALSVPNIRFAIARPASPGLPVGAWRCGGPPAGEPDGAGGDACARHLPCTWRDGVKATTQAQKNILLGIGDHLKRFG